MKLKKLLLTLTITCASITIPYIHCDAETSIRTNTTIVMDQNGSIKEKVEHISMNRDPIGSNSTDETELCTVDLSATDQLVLSKDSSVTITSTGTIKSIKSNSAKVEISSAENSFSIRCIAYRSYPITITVNYEENGILLQKKLKLSIIKE